MRTSSLFQHTDRAAPAGADVESHRLLLRAGYVRPLAGGVFTLLPMGLRATRRVEAVVRQEIEAIGGQELAMPHVLPRWLWERSGRLAAWSDALATFGDSVVAATHEEAVAALAAELIHSWRDLPRLVYQIQAKYRHESRPRAGLIRAREFTMKDSYSLDADEAGMLEQYEAHRHAYRRVFERLSLPVVEVESDAAPMGGYAAHEYMHVCRIGEDTLLLCSGCGWAANREAAGQRTACPRCSAALQTERGVEVGNIFQFGPRYSEMFGAQFTDSDGRRRPVWMGSYGLGIGRTLACLAEVHHDEAGLAWPDAVAPYSVVLVSVRPCAEAEAAYARLMERSVEVLYDDRDVAAGVKFADADLSGIPWRMVVGPRSAGAGGVELSRRRGQDAGVLPLTAAVARLAARARSVPV